MAEEETSSRIEELKARLEADPGSRVFYQLGEELRKTGHAEEAENVLRTGLEKHPAYLSAWISLGRVLKETERTEEAIEVLNRAFELDRQNVVVARLLGDAYAQTGDHVEAIKKYKLVAALHPADEEVQDKIREIEIVLEQEGKLETPSGATPPQPEPEPPTEQETPAEEADESSAIAPEPEPEPEPDELERGIEAPSDGDAPVEEPFALGGDADTDTAADTGAAADATPEPDEPGAGAPISPEEDLGTEEGPVFGSDASSDEAQEPEPAMGGDEDDVVATVTMGDLYARQGHVEQAREIYRKVLTRNPEHPEAAERLSSLDEPETPETDQSDSSDSPTTKEAKVLRLETWLSKVNRS